MSAFSQLVFYLLTAAFVQNLVLSAGFGSSTLLRITRRPRDILLFSGMLCGFSLLTVLIAYPLDLLIGTSWDAKLIRPVLLIVIAALLYIGAAPDPEKAVSPCLSESAPDPASSCLQQCSDRRRPDRQPSIFRFPGRGCRAFPRQLPGISGAVPADG